MAKYKPPKETVWGFCDICAGWERVTYCQGGCGKLLCADCRSELGLCYECKRKKSSQIRDKKGGE